MGKRIALIFSFVLLIVVLLVIFFMSNSVNSFINDSTKKEFEDSSFSDIEVISNHAVVEIISTKDSITTVEYTGKKKKNAKYIFTAEIKNDKLSVQLKEKRKSFFSLGFYSSEILLTVKVPDEQYNLIKVNGDNGKIIAENINTENLVLETDNGNIELKNVEASSVNVETDNGKITLDQVSGDIFGETDNGGISLVTSNLDRQIELTTDNGRIEITTENEPTNASIIAETDNGVVKVFGKENKHTTFGQGKHLIKLKSDNGRITVTK